MKLLKLFFFVGLIYGVSSRDFFPDLDPYIRALLEASRGIINKWAVSLIESQRENISTGFPAIGIPPGDPLVIDNLELPLGTTNLTLSDANLTGLSKFNINYFDLKFFGLYFAFIVHFDRLEIEGRHDTYTKVGFISQHGQGDIDVILDDIAIHGIIELDVTSANTLILKKISADFEVANVDVTMTGFLIPALDTAISALVEEALKLLIKSGDFPLQLITDTLTIPINLALSQVTLPDILVSVIEFIRQYN